MVDWDFGTPDARELAWRRWVEDEELEFETGVEMSWYQDAFNAGWDANNLEGVRKLATGEAGLLLIPESLSFPHFDNGEMAEELAELVNMPVLCGPKEALDSVEVLDLLREAKAEGWHFAHDTICDLGKFCSRHRPMYQPGDPEEWTTRNE